MNAKHLLLGCALGLLVLLLSACQFDIPKLSEIRDSKLLDRRIKETPRQKTIRECQQESERYRVSCTHCHSTEKVDDIQAPDRRALTKVGERAHIMRTSPSFGLNQDCSSCHQSKFRLNRSAQKLFGPGGPKHQDAQKELKAE